MPPFAQFGSELLTVEDAGDRGIAPLGLARPHPFCGKRREKPSVNGAAERDRAVGNGEDVLPERVAGPEGLHGGEVGAPARVDGVVRGVRRRSRRRRDDLALERRVTTVHAATGIAAASAASTSMAFVLVPRSAKREGGPDVRLRMVCLIMAIQTAAREAPRPGTLR